MARQGGYGVSIGVNVDASKGVKGFREVESGAAGAEQAMKRLSTQARVSGAELDRAFSGSASLDPFTASVARATNSLGGLETRLRGIPAALGQFGGLVGLGAGGLAAGVLAIAKASADAASEIGGLSQRTGIGTESLSRLAYAVRVTGGATGDLEGGLQSLSKNMQAAAKGGTASATMFDQLGIAVTRSDGSLRGAEEVFVDLAQRLSELPNGATKTTAAVALLGNSAEKLIPALNEGKLGLEALANESDRAGQTISESAAAAALEFNKNLERLQGLANGVAIQIGNALIPAINELAADFLRARQAGLSFGEALVGIGLSSPFKTADEQVKSLSEKLTELKKRREDALGFVGGRAEASAVLPMIDSEIALRQRELAYWESKVNEAQGGPDTTEAKQRAEERLKVEQQLAAEVAGLAKIRETAASNATKEEIRGAERLRDALREAWRESSAAAREARNEAAAFFREAGAAANRRNVEANRIDASSPEPQGGLRGFDNSKSPGTLVAEAERAALFAQNAAIDGRSDAVRKNAEEAIRLSEEAAAYLRKMGDDPSAAKLLRQLGEAEKQALEAQGKQRQQEAAAQESAATAIATQIQAAEQQILALKSQLAEPVSISADISKAEQQIDALRTRLDGLQDRKVTVTVNTIETTTPAGDAPPAFWSGGHVRGPGTGTSDSILARLSNGEYVLRAAAVRRYGLSFLNSINQLRMPRFADGGLVSSASRVMHTAMSADSAADRVSGTPITLDFGELGRFQAQAAPDVAGEIVKVFQRAALQRGRR